MKNYSRIKLAINEQANIVVQAEKRLAQAEQTIAEARAELAKVTGDTLTYTELMTELDGLDKNNAAVASLVAEKEAIQAEAAVLKTAADAYKIAVDGAKV